MGLWGACRRHMVGPNALSMAFSQFNRLEFCMSYDNNLTMFWPPKIVREPQPWGPYSELFIGGNCMANSRLIGL